MSLKVQHPGRPDHVRRKTRIALVTAQHVDYKATDDLRLFHSLSRREAHVEWACWDDRSVDWSRFDLVLIRSAWDYHLRFDEFSAWLDAQEAAGTRLYNAPPLVRWNMHKEYLLELNGAGIPIPRSILLRRGEPSTTVRTIAEQLGSRRLVIKPAVSASSRGTVLIEDPAASEADEQLAALRGQHDVLVQRFVPEIQSRGELSLVFFGGTFSHAVRKTPVPGEFRSQSSFGARVERVRPDATSVDLAHDALSALREQPLYARVDLVQAEEGPVLMELELIEPVLFFGHAPLSSDVLASLILRRTSDREDDASAADQPTA